MPIKPAEPDLFPPDLWERVAPPLKSAPHHEGTGPRWWCLHTKPRQEKATARHLRSAGLTYYLPQAVREGRTPEGRKIRSLIPLFPSYLFLFEDELGRVESMRRNTLVQVLEIADQGHLDRDLRQIHRLVSSGLTVIPEPTYPTGSRVRINTGPLAGMTGVVLRRQKQDAFVALVRFLGRGASVDLEDWQVEPVAEH